MKKPVLILQKKDESVAVNLFRDGGITMKKKKPFVEPLLYKHKEKLDEMTKFNDLGSHGAGTGANGSSGGKRSRCPLGYK